MNEDNRAMEYDTESGNRMPIEDDQVIRDLMDREPVVYASRPRARCLPFKLYLFLYSCICNCLVLDCGRGKRRAFVSQVYFKHVAVWFPWYRLCVNIPKGNHVSGSEEDYEHEETEKSDCFVWLICTLWKCITLQWLCPTTGAYTWLRLMCCVVVVAGFVLAYGYIVMINDLIAHSYETPTHGTPHVVHETQVFYRN